VRNFAIGLILGMLGAVLGIVAGVMGGFAEASEGQNSGVTIFFRSLMGIGFGAMFLGPLTYWVIVPIVGAIRRRRSG